MTTLAEMIDRCSNILADPSNTTYSDALITEWLSDAIADYSIHFGRLKTSSHGGGIVSKLDLEVGTIAVLSVEFPVGQTPKQFIPYSNYSQELFHQGQLAYRRVPYNDPNNSDRIEFSESIDLSPSLNLRFTITHGFEDSGTGILYSPSAASSADTFSIPDHHENILLLFVEWQATRYLMHKEQQSPTSGSSLLMSQFSSNASSLHTKYKEAIVNAGNDRQTSEAVQWKLDKWD